MSEVIMPFPARLVVMFAVVGRHACLPGGIPVPLLSEGTGRLRCPCRPLNLRG